MKLFKKTAIATSLVLSVFAMGAAQALTISPPGVSAANLNVTVKDGVATIFGSADSLAESSQAEQYVAGLDGVDQVINLVTFN